MFRRFWTQLGVFLSMVTLAGCASAQVAEGGRRIVAIGDLHGDYNAWRAIAGSAGLIDAGGHWSGGQTVLVQVGDVVDRGPRSLDIVHDLMRLQGEAAHAGGRVVALVGNHEAMNMTGDLRYVSPGDYGPFITPESERLRDQVYQSNRAAIETAYRTQDPALSAEAIRQSWMTAVPLGQIEHQRAWSPQGEIGRWIVSNPAVLQLDGTIFVHGGIGADYARSSPNEINRKVAAALTARETRADSIINDPSGPLWYRGLVAAAAVDDSEKTAPGGAAQKAAPLSPEAELDQVLAAYGARRMVIGHTPILSGIAVLHDGKLVRIDTGISSFYGGKLSYLEIIGGQAVPHELARPGPDH